MRRRVNEKEILNILKDDEEGSTQKEMRVKLDTTRAILTKYFSALKETKHNLKENRIAVRLNVE